VLWHSCRVVIFSPRNRTPRCIIAADIAEETTLSNSGTARVILKLSRPKHYTFKRNITHLSKNNFILYIIPIIKSTLYFSNNNLIFITVFHRSIIDRSSTKREEIFYKVMILLIMIFILYSFWDNITLILILLLGNYTFNYRRYEQSENSCWISCYRRSRKRDLKVCFFFEGTSWLLLPWSFVHSTVARTRDFVLWFTGNYIIGIMTLANISHAR